MKFTTKPATTKDIPLIMSIANVAFRDTYKDILSADQMEYMMNWMYSEESLHKQIEEDGHVYQIYYADDVPCGYVSVQQEADDLFHLQKIYLLPQYQGKNIGRLLFSAAIIYIKEVHPGPCRMELNVNRYNKALGFYEHLGMKKLREGDFDIGGGYYMNDYIMGIDL